jgi:hypothetical protein
MTDIHIDDFYKDVAKIFLRLYNSFPRKTILYVEDICGADDTDEFGLHSERFLSGFSAMVWLGDHDYLHYEAPIKQEALDQVVLTQRGFIRLSSRSDLDFGDLLSHENAADKNVPPSVIEQSKTNIYQLRKALNSGSSIMIRQCVQYLLSQD